MSADRSLLDKSARLRNHHVQGHGPAQCNVFSDKFKVFLKDAMPFDPDCQLNPPPGRRVQGAPLYVRNVPCNVPAIDFPGKSNSILNTF